MSVLKIIMLEIDSNIDFSFETCELDELLLQPPQILFAHPEEFVLKKLNVVSNLKTYKRAWWQLLVMNLIL